MRKINFRPLFFGLIAFCVAMVLCRYIFEMQISKIIFLAIGFIFIFVLCVCYKQYKNLIVLIVSFMLGFSCFYFVFTNYSAEKYNEEVQICARVENVKENSSYYSVILEEVKINGKNENYKIVATSSSVFGVGERIEFCATLKSVELFEDGNFNSYYYKNKIEYKTNISGEVVVRDGGLKLNEKAIKYFNKVVENNLTNQTSGIVKTIFIGDKTLLDDEIKSTFENVGIAHLLAISGLHIAVIVSILAFVLEKLKVKRIAKFVVMFVLLLFYCYICNFSPSVVRASLMSLVFLLAKVLGKKYDKLNALSISAIIILLFKPLYIFDAGFLLSYLCVFSIFVMHKMFSKLFVKFKFKKLASAISLVMCVQVGILPVILMFYSSVNILSLLVNLICVPIFEFVFVLSFVVILLCLLLPFMSFLFKICESAIVGFVYLAKVFSNVTFFTIQTKQIPQFLIMPIYSSVFVCSQYVNIQKVYKVCTVLLVASMVLLCLYFV